MSFDAPMAVIGGLNVSVEALAALVAHLRVHSEQLDPAPQVAALVESVVIGLGLDPSMIASIPRPQLRSAIGAARGFLWQAEDLIDAVDRAPGWVYEDPALLQSQGQASMLVAGLIERIAPGRSDLDARLRAAAPGSSTSEPASACSPWPCASASPASASPGSTRGHPPSTWHTATWPAPASPTGSTCAGNRSPTSTRRPPSMRPGWRRPFLPGPIWKRVCTGPASRSGPGAGPWSASTPPRPNRWRRRSTPFAPSGRVATRGCRRRRRSSSRAKASPTYRSIEGTWNAPIRFVVGRC